MSRGNVQLRLSQGLLVTLQFLLYFTDRKSEPLLRPDAKDHSKVKDQMSAQLQPKSSQPKLGNNVLLQDTFLHHSGSSKRKKSLLMIIIVIILLLIAQNT